MREVGEKGDSNRLQDAGPRSNQAVSQLFYRAPLSTEGIIKHPAFS